MREKTFHIAAAVLVIGASMLVVVHEGWGRLPLATREGFAVPDMALVTEPGPDRFADWVRPAGPPRVALQAGHWKKEEAPDELEKLRGYGAEVAGLEEWEVTLSIAREAEEMLEAEGVATEVLPTTVPPGYVADAFVSIHADESPNRRKTGYKTAGSGLDRSGRSRRLADAVGSAYGAATGMGLDGEVTDEMRWYYAFNWRLYEHTLHPRTPAAIIETGFLTSAEDRKLIVQEPKKAARTIADGVLAYLRGEGLLGL